MCSFRIAPGALDQLLTGRTQPEEPDEEMALGDVGDMGGAADDAKSATVYYLALLPEGHGRHRAPGWRAVLTDFAVRWLQPGSPVYAHCELCLPVAGKPGIFASYYSTHGRGGANWQDPTPAERVYYVSDNAPSWRALPLRVTPEQALRMRDAANAAVGAPYSFARFVSSGYVLRRLAWLLPSGGQNAGHCATICARVLQAGAPELLAHAEAFYSPSTLTAELQTRIARGPVGGLPVGEAAATDALTLPEVRVKAFEEATEFEALQTIEVVGKAHAAPVVDLSDNVLMHGSDADVAALTFAQRSASLDALADRALDARAVGERDLYQTLLARALFRHVLL
jgi:hypothetical protein